MCGIIGTFVSIGEAAALKLEPIHHRGPDAQGDFRSQNKACWLGHTRLSILELSTAGSQPMTDSSGRYTIVFNGEIYNHLAIRGQLTPRPWRGQSDTETLVEAWREWGESCLNRIRGMFAFAVYDQSEHSLTLVRDRFGIKPLYFRQKQNEFCFASEVRAINGGSNLALTESSIATYLSFGHLQSFGCLGNDVHCCPVGTLLRIDRNGSRSVKQWWNFEAEIRSSGQLDEHVPIKNVRSLVELSVKEHLLSDVPIGCFLSGGIDSSILALTAARFVDGSLKTFTVGFKNAELDERSIASEVAKIAGSEHHEVVLTEKLCLEWVVESIKTMDCPSVDAINTYIVSKAVALAGIKVAMSGLGSDEIFGGYPSFSAVSRMKWLRLLPAPVRDYLVRFAPARVREKLTDCKSIDNFLLGIAYRRWMNSQSLKEFGINQEALFPQASLRIHDLYQNISDAEIHGYMEPMLLRDSDQMSMAVSLELRVPFLDHRLVSYVLGLSTNIKAGIPSKKLLTEAFKDVLPVQVWNRPKMGFTLPMSDWMKGPLKGIVVDGTRKLARVLNENKIVEVERKFSSGKVHWTRLWSLVVLGHYLDRT